MQRRLAPAGIVGEELNDARELADVPVGKQAWWDDYLDAPNEERLGICVSGGGIRSASFGLGGLQVLQERKLFGSAAHLACVSGGAYISIAHTVVVDQTLKLGREPNTGGPSKETAYFATIKPWAAGSTEELHLRDQLNYIAPGAQGKVWLYANFLFGMIRHLLPFAAVIYLAAFITGIGMSRWLGPTLRSDCDPCLTRGALVPFLWLSLAVIAVSGLVIGVRVAGNRKGFRDETMYGLQSFSLAALGIGLLILAVFILLPAVLLSLHDGLLDWIGAKIAGLLTLSAITASGAVGWLIKNRYQKWLRFLLAIVISLSAPIAVLVPFIGLTYWNAQAGVRWSEDWGRWVAALVALVLIVVFTFWLDEVTSSAHLYYRERLATAFVGYRQMMSDPMVPNQPVFFRWAQPSWQKAIDFSDTALGTDAAKLPNLIVCTAANLSDTVPIGRLATSFTFERDRVGGPVIGYVPTRWMERSAGGGVLSVPSLMAVSGAAIAPSMGKMTKPALRFLMAAFNLRLGLWVPNPHRSPGAVPASAFRSDVVYVPNREAVDAYFEEEVPKLGKSRYRPGGLYVFREALGRNKLDDRFLYVTDGGHWENLGLVELLRRGCGKIVCLDGSGGDAKSFGTLSEAIALARADLGVEIQIDLSEMRSVAQPDGQELSGSGYAVGRITYPDKTSGVLVYIRAVLTTTSPEALRNYGKKDKKFPNHPTSDQFFDEERFEAYRSLGRHLTDRAIRCIR